ncbi:MAG TPA: hypothetical protein VMU17_01310, partial [Elusimicrobiota bacterium]|nr:hypothetical protein [Elusimicrobiota bacterium]
MNPRRSSFPLAVPLRQALCLALSLSILVPDAARAYQSKAVINKVVISDSSKTSGVFLREALSLKPLQYFPGPLSNVAQVVHHMQSDVSAGSIVPPSLRTPVSTTHRNGMTRFKAEEYGERARQVIGDLRAGKMGNVLYA